jgi:16S rRNA (adenine1518-N6/adenine1519-N6)-dimethyltransferase
VSTDPRTVLKELEARAKKRFGQHFLTRRDVVERMVRATPVEAGDRVVEIGPGLGILTDVLLEVGAEVTAVEIDRDLAAWIGETRPAVRLVRADAMRVDWAELCPGGGWKMVSNLPYNVGTPIVADAMALRGTFSVLTVMLQKEVVLRLLAEPDTDAYGALSVRTAAYTVATPVVHVPPAAFHPPPRVDSMVVRLELRPEPLVGPAGERAFDRVVKAAFAQRRKTILNSVSTLFPKPDTARALEAAAIPANARAETLDLGAFQALAAALHPPV